jgi:hypothetical protein
MFHHAEMMLANIFFPAPSAEMWKISGNLILQRSQRKKEERKKEKENNTFDDTNWSLFDLKTSSLSYENCLHTNMEALC